MPDIQISTNINSMNEGDSSNLEFVYRYREQGETAWIESSATSNTDYTISGLPNSTTYECQVLATETVLNKSLETPIKTITTSGSGGGDITTGLIAHYTMDNISGNTLIDEQGFSDGTLFGGWTAVANGIQFDGSTGYADLNNTFNYITNTNIFTISIDIYRNSSTFGDTIDTLLSSSFASATNGLSIAYDNRVVTGSNKIIRLFYQADAPNNTATDIQVTNNIPSDINKHNIIASGDGTTLRLYLDNVEIGSVNFVSTALSAPNNIFLAAFNNNGTAGLFSDVTIGETRFYNRALSQADRDLLNA
ncbi:LamG-like jellyroll fold domain-containing protein [Francisella marina]|uniref:LamG-like jellyroll fold domain-containing protein n=1 Tax=Francisella marina TaxID=2249302 RepID=UPI0011EC2A80|nr:LamG-like jellyroll fold domain-containing protein [Francisella marina]QEO58336.1 hypothetical protein F0R75_00565 [Francisella marina]